MTVLASMLANCEVPSWFCSCARPEVSVWFFGSVMTMDGQ